MPTLVLGRAADAEVLLRAIESGAVSKIRPVGILSPARSDRVAGDPRHSGARRSRRSRAGGRRSCRSRHQGHAPGADAERAGAGGRARIDPDAGAPARACDQPAAGARRGRRGAAACAGQCRGPAAAAERQDRLRPPRIADQGRLRGRHRRRRLDRRGNLRPAGDLRRRAPAGDREFRAGAARGARDARRQEIRAAIDGRIADIRDRDRILRLVKDFKPDIVFPCRGAQARAAARARLGRGRQDQRVRLGQRRRCGGRSRRARHGDDLDRQGDRADLGAGRDQALRRDVLPGARRRPHAPRRRPPKEPAHRRCG